MRNRYIAILAIAVSLPTGCSPMSSLSWQTRNVPSNFVPGTQVLGQVIGIATREAVLEGEGLFEGWYDSLMSAGYSDSAVVHRSEIIAWAYCYGHNASVPACAHHGHYRAHVPADLRAELQAYSSPGTGDLVQIELSANNDGTLIGEVVAVYRRSGEWVDCREAELQIKSGIVTAITYGPPHGSWIECDSIQDDGWQRVPVRGAPSNDGPPLSVWMKMPYSEME